MSEKQSLGDVKAFFLKVLKDGDAYSASDEWRVKYQLLAGRVIASVMEENGIVNSDESMAMPNDIELGPKATKAFKEFRTFFDSLKVTK